MTRVTRDADGVDRVEVYFHSHLSGRAVPVDEVIFSVEEYLEIAHRSQNFEALRQLLIMEGRRKPLVRAKGAAA